MFDYIILISEFRCSSSAEIACTFKRYPISALVRMQVVEPGEVLPVWLCVYARLEEELEDLVG